MHGCQLNLMIVGLSTEGGFSYNFTIILFIKIHAMTIKTIFFQRIKTNLVWR